MRFGVDELIAEVTRALELHGVPADEAAAGAQMCVDSELRAHHAHGVGLLRNVLGQYAASADRRAPVRVTHETPVSARVDGGFHLSWFVHQRAVDVAIAKARDAGVGLVSVVDAGVSGALGYPVERIAQAGLVGVALNSTPLVVVAPGSSTASLGTNPLAIAVPRKDRSPVVLDMATSAIAYNEIKRLQAAGESLPEGVATDASGQLAIDPSQAVDPATGRGRILPFGGHRGYGLALMVELLVAAGVAGATADRKRGPVVNEPADFAALYLAYDPGLVGDPESSSAAVEALVQDLQAQRVRIPGEHGRERRERCLREGSVEISEQAAQLLAALTREGPMSDRP